MAKKGGKQPGAGRPLGSTTKPRLSDFLKQEEIDAIVNKAKDMALNGNEAMIKMLVEQFYGKAMQPVEGEFKANINISFDEAFTPPKTDSK